MKSEKNKRLFWWFLTVAAMILIFYFSSRNGESSAALSIGYAKDLARLIGSSPDKVHTFVRKVAHFLEYAVLGFASYQALHVDIQGKNCGIFAQAISSLYAVTDECHQIFVPGRDGKPKDVIIDSFGAFTGIIFAYVTLRIIKKYS